MLVFQSFNGSAPQYLADLSQILRSADQLRAYTPKSRLKCSTFIFSEIGDSVLHIFPCFMSSLSCSLLLSSTHFSLLRCTLATLLFATCVL